MRQADAMRFRNQAKQMAIAVEAPRAAVLNYLEARLVMAIEQLVGKAAGSAFICQLQSLGAKPLHAHNRDCFVRQNASDRGCGLEILKAAHVLRISSAA